MQNQTLSEKEKTGIELRRTIIDLKKNGATSDETAEILTKKGFTTPRGFKPSGGFVRLQWQKMGIRSRKRRRTRKRTANRASLPESPQGRGRPPVGVLSLRRKMELFQFVMRSQLPTKVRNDLLCLLSSE